MNSDQTTYRSWWLLYICAKFGWYIGRRAGGGGIIRLDAQSNYTQPIAAVSLNNMLRRTRRAGHLALPARHLPVTSHHPCGCGRAAADMHTLVYLCDTGIAYVEPCVQKLRSSSLKDAQFADSRAV